MIVFLFSFLWGHSFCREVTLWFLAEKKNMALCSVYCLSCLRLSSAKLSHGVLFIFNFDIFYCLLYTLSLFTTNLDIEIWQWRAGLCKEFSAAGQSYLTVNTFDYCICWIFLWSFFFFNTIATTPHCVQKRRHIVTQVHFGQVISPQILANQNDFECSPETTSKPPYLTWEFHISDHTHTHALACRLAAWFWTLTSKVSRDEWSLAVSCAAGAPVHPPSHPLLASSVHHHYSKYNICLSCSCFLFHLYSPNFNLAMVVWMWGWKWLDWAFLTKLLKKGNLNIPVYN